MNLLLILSQSQVKILYSFPLTSYVARHSWATIADKLGVDRRTIKDGLCQQDLQTTNIYIDDIVSGDVLEQADELISF